MKNYQSLIEKAMKEPAFDRFMNLPLPIRTTVAWGMTSAEPIGAIENSLEFALKRTGHGWFARRRLRTQVMADVKAMLEPDMVEATFAGFAYCLMALVGEIAGSLPRGERGEALSRLVANVRAQAGARVAMFDLSDVEALLSEGDPALAHDERSVQERAEAVGLMYAGQLLRNVAIGIARALKDEDGEMSSRRQRVYRAFSEGAGLRLGDDGGESGCPNCGSESFEVVQRDELRSVSRPKEFKESTTRGTRTKVMKVSFDRTREERRCADCCFEWKFVVDSEQ
ncbi:MAG: hypothetical protein KF891_01325 [Rhizobacter sp.]|nr:hypothetical protein [Rhizobacter sp.]